MFGNASKGMLENKTFSKIGIGVIVNNDFLVFSSFQISLSYYPSIAGNGINILKLILLKPLILVFRILNLVNRERSFLNKKNKSI